MLTWLLDVTITTIGVLCVLAFLYGVVARDNNAPKRHFSRLDRRGYDTLDRRRENLGPPVNLMERRIGPRRAVEMR
jgi:hypothetical protein